MTNSKPQPPTPPPSPEEAVEALDAALRRQPMVVLEKEEADTVRAALIAQHGDKPDYIPPKP